MMTLFHAMLPVVLTSLNTHSVPVNQKCGVGMVFTNTDAHVHRQPTLCVSLSPDRCTPCIAVTLRLKRFCSKQAKWFFTAFLSPGQRKKVHSVCFKYWNYPVSSRAVYRNSILLWHAVQILPCQNSPFLNYWLHTDELTFKTMYNQDIIMKCWKENGGNIEIEHTTSLP